MALGISDYIISIIMFTLVIVGGVSMFSEYSKTDPNFTNDPTFTDFNKSFNKLNDVTSEVDKIKTNINRADEDQGILGTLNSFISGAWNSLKLTFSSYTFMNDAYEGYSANFGIPAWIITLLSLVVTVIIGFAIYSAIFQKNV